MTDFETTPLEKQYRTVNGKQMAFHERGDGCAEALYIIAVIVCLAGPEPGELFRRGLQPNPLC